MMKVKKILAALTVGTMLFATVPLAAPVVSDGLVSTAYAAKGGARIKAPSAPRTAPSAGAHSSTQSSPSKSVSGSGETYKPSKSAGSLAKDAPSASSSTRPGAAAGTAGAANAAQSSSTLGRVMRGVGLFAGGMFLGSMLSHAFGLGSMGGGLVPDMLGLIFNLLFLYIVYRVIRYAISAFRGRRDGSATYTRYNMSNRSSYGGRETIDITPQSSTQVRDITPPTSSEDDGYDPKRTADRYRNS